MADDIPKGDPSLLTLAVQMGRVEEMLRAQQGSLDETRKALASERDKVDERLRAVESQLATITAKFDRDDVREEAAASVAANLVSNSISKKQLLAMWWGIGIAFFAAVLSATVVLSTHS